MRFHVRPLKRHTPPDFEIRDQSPCHPIVNAPNRLPQPLCDIFLFDEGFSRLPVSLYLRCSIFVFHLFDAAQRAVIRSCSSIGMGGQTVSGGGQTVSGQKKSAKGNFRGFNDQFLVQSSQTTPEGGSYVNVPATPARLREPFPWV